ncbi:hypothetical protein [Ktedonobacter robiniae]|uniref:DUF4760 domain-containing protein n=1 Tax=Ktedonobacter robiniae TaxID=2778365 RepID=A0ABQ3UI33_9CHLR|nr:hypothetical protein [Ktedonobacter robiniae]GHO52379.1 hypothetical protein KSB_08540 [Ktedonobacter robiniae]
MVEIIVALIAVFGVVFPYLFQRNRELNAKIADQKREAYENFLYNFTEMTVEIMHGKEASGKETDLKRMSARDKLVLYASDEVIKAYDTWVRYGDAESHDWKKDSELMDLILLAIRKDLLLGKTKLTRDHITNLNSFNRG